MNGCALLDQFYGKSEHPESISQLDADILVFQRDHGWVMSDDERKAIIQHLELD